MKKCVKTAINAVLSTALVMLIIGCWTLIGVEANDDTTYTFSKYRENTDKDENGNWIDVPEKEGYVFAGWYNEETKTYATKEETEGNYTAKFVPEDVLSVKLQLKSSDSTDPVTSKTSKADLRLITSVDTLDYSSVGFKVTGTKTKTYISNTVYQTIKGYTYIDENKVEQTYTPKAFCEESNYFMSHIVQNANNDVGLHDDTDQFGTTLTVVPQWTTLDGTLVYGVERSFEINDGIEEYVAEINEVNGSGEKGDHVWYTTLSDAVTAANGSDKSDAVTIGLLRNFSLGARVTTKRDINIVNNTFEDITISRSENITDSADPDYTMINHAPTEAATLAIGTSDAGAPKIIFDGTDPAEEVTNKGVTLYNNSTTGTMYLNKNVTVKNAKTTVDSSHGAGGFNNKGTAYVSATFTGCEGGNGGAIYSNGGTVYFDGNIENCDAYHGGAIYGDGTAIINMTGGTIKSCTATVEGGGIRAANVNMTDGTIQSCTATAGGAMRLNAGVVEGTIDSCVAIDVATGTATTDNKGGGVFVDGTGPNVTMTNATITKCEAYQGGGVYVNIGKFTIASGTISSCDASNLGGGIYINQDAEATKDTIVTMTTGTITGCTAAQGAGVDLMSGTFTMLDGSIDNCTATGNGGGIYGGGTAVINVEGGTIDTCTAGNEGGGIRGAGNATVNFTGGTIESCQAFRGGGIRLTNGTIQGTINNCNAVDNDTTDEELNQGGGVYVYANSTTIEMKDAIIDNCEAYQGAGVYVINSGTFTLSSGTISNCTASAQGGGIYSNQAITLNINGGSIDTCISDGTATGTNQGGAVYTVGAVNMSAGTITGCTAARGAGIYAAASTGVVTMTGGTIESCTVTDNGAGIYGTGDATINFNGGEIKSCTANAGGGIRLAKGTIQGKITSCNAKAGGGVYADGTASVEMDGATISSCEATYDYGGGIYLTAGELTLKNGTIKGCSATTSGGGVYTKDGTLTVSGGTITGCSATNGGGIFENKGTFTLSNATIQSCTATLGGGVYASAGTFTMSSGTIQNCEATSQGGGIQGTTSATVKFTGGTIYKCSAANGGGIRIITGEIAGGTIDTCSATAHGGGVLFDGTNLNAIVSMTGGTIQNCSATYGGGASVSFGADRTIVMSDGLIQNCTATHGGAVSFDAQGTFEMTGGTIQNCTADEFGGGIYNGNKYSGYTTYATSVINLKGGTIDNCDSLANGTDTARGGGVYSLGTVNMSAGTVTNGNAYRGSGIYMGTETGILNMSGGTITNCVSVERGGGIYAEGAATINFNAGTIESCKALQGGGICLTKGAVKGTITDCHAVDNNTTDETYSNYGGGVYALGAITMSGTLENCTAYRGAGVYTSSTFTMTDGNITNCDSKENGAGVYGTGAATINFNGGMISSCDSENGAGGGIRLTSGTIKGTISNCTAKSGGAIYLDGTTPSATVAGGTISGCTAATYGGGVYVNKAGTLTMNGGTITGCTGNNVGGAIRLESGANFTMTGGSLTSNFSKNLGGAIHAAGSNEITLTAGEISGNTSSHADGGGTVNGIQASGCGTATTITLGSTFNMGANSIRITDATARTDDPVLVINGTSLANPLYIAMSDSQQPYVQIQCDSATAATNICSLIDSIDGKATFTTNGSVIEASAPATIKSMSFNVLGSGKEDTYLTAATRAPYVYSYLNSSGMDLIGIQEAQEGTSYDWQTGFKNNIASTYKMIRIKDQSGYSGTVGIGHGLIILYKADRFTLQSNGVEQYDSDSSRWFQWAKFTDNTTGKTVYMTNTHWSIVKDPDGNTLEEEGLARRTEQAQQLLDFWKGTVGNNILIATGDYNCLATSSEMQLACGDVFKTADVAGLTPITACWDHIVVNSNLMKVQNYKLDTSKFEYTDGNKYNYSDHNPRVLITSIQ